MSTNHEGRCNPKGNGGGRNDALIRVAGRLRAQGKDHDAILAHLMACPERAGLPEVEVRGVAKSASRFPAGTPRAALAARTFRDAVEELATRRCWHESAIRALGGVVGPAVSRDDKHGGEVWIPMRDASGAVVGHRRRRGDNARFGRDADGPKALSEKGKPLGLMATWPLPDGVVLVVEGEADACAALTAIPTLAIVAKPGAKPGKRCLEWLQRLLAGRDVVLCPDPDAVGREGAEQTARALAGAGCAVRLIPPLDDLDLDKRLAREPEGQRGAKLRELIDAAIAWKPATAPKAKDTDAGAAPDNRRPVVELTPEEARVADVVLGHLAVLDSMLFRRGGQLATICEGDALDPARVRLVCKHALRERIARHVTLVRHVEEGEPPERAHVPRWLPEALLARGEWPALRRLTGVVEAPFMRPDGSICQAPGWDEPTGNYLVLRAAFPPIPDAPTVEEARAAAARLLDVVADFPFADATARSVWVAAVLTMAGREAIEGPTPLFGFDANVRGAGKTLLASVAALIATGRMPPMASAPESDAEARKRITSLAVEGARVALIDNVGEPLGCESLDACLTSTTWQDRILGQSTLTPPLPMRAVWLATGNGLAFRGDTVRRALVCQLDSPLENPEARAGSAFRHPELVAHVTRTRPALYVDALTILRGFVAAGRPSVAVAAFGSFEAWRSVVPAAIVWAGLPDPLGSRRIIAEDGDTDRDFLAALFVELDRLDPDGRGVLAADLVLSESKPWGDAMAAALNGRPNARTLAAKMSRLARRVVGGRRLGKRVLHGAMLWFGEKAGG